MLPRKGIRAGAVLAGLICVIAAGAHSRAARAAEQAQPVEDPAAVRPDWQTADRGAMLGVSRLSPGQVHAFYRARGFDSEAAAEYAAACVFQMVLRNDAAGGTLASRLADWRIRTAAGTQRFVPLEAWEREWSRRGVSEAARIAFRWAQFPAVQDFAPGDWIMGMVALTPRPKGTFELDYTWSIDGISHRGTLRGLECAAGD